MINPTNKNIEIKEEGRRERGQTIYQPNKTKKKGKKNYPAFILGVHSFQ